MRMEHGGKSPRIAPGVYLAPTAIIVGDVEIGEGASVWFGAVIRGDRTPIRIGRNTNVQDNCTIHSDPPYPVSIGDNVSIGHNAVIHGAVVEDGCLIGMGAVLLNGVVMREGSIVAPGSVVREGQVVGPHHLVAGVPASLKKELGPDEVLRSVQNAQTYGELARAYLAKAPR